MSRYESEICERPGRYTNVKVNISQEQKEKTPKFYEISS